MIKRNQSGALDLHVIMIIVVTILAGSFLTFRIVSSNTEQGSATTGSSDSLADEAASDISETDGAETVNEESQAEETTNETEELNTNQSGEPETTNNTVTALFTKGGVGSVVGTTINVSATMNGSYSGECTFSFILGNTLVEETTQITNSSTCQKDISVFDFPKNGTYDLGIRFASTDGSVQAEIDGFTVPITPDEFFFTKGGGNYDGTNVVVSETSLKGHTGTCNYLFTNGNSRVEKSNTINNSRTCTITIPGSEFPKSGNWQYDLVFNGTNEFVVGTGGGFTIEID